MQSGHQSSGIKFRWDPATETKAVAQNQALEGSENADIDGTCGISYYSVSISNRTCGLGGLYFIRGYVGRE